MKILFLCNKSPYPHREGGPIAMNRMIEGMIRQGHEVMVVGINSFKYHVDLKDVPEDYKRKTRLELHFLDLRLKPLDAFLNLFTRKSYHVERFISDKLKQRLAQILTDDKFDVVQMETLYMAPYIETIRNLSPESKIVLRAHNIEYFIWDRVRKTTSNLFKKIYLKHIVNTLRNFELNAFKKFDGIAAITGHDADFIRKYNKKTVAIPFGIYPDSYRVSSPDEWEFPSLFHIGSMNWIPNEEGIRWFLREVWPLIHQKHPELLFYLAGRHMPEWLKNIQSKGVKVLGEVDSAERFISEKGIMIVPLLSGSGIRIKIIEGMAAAKPVVSTSTGAEGIEVSDGKDILLADSPQEMAEAISRLVNDKQSAMALANNARKTIEERYDNTKLMKRLHQFYMGI